MKTMIAKMQVLAAVIFTSTQTVFAVNDRGSASQVAALEQLLWKLAKPAANSAASMEETLKMVHPHDADEGKALQDMVTQLTGKAQSAFGDEPMGEAVTKIIDLIDGMFPKEIQQHKADQDELQRLADAVQLCSDTKNSGVAIADKSKKTYLNFSPLHQTCRTGEAGLFTSKKECHDEKSNSKKVMELRKTAFDLVTQEVGNQNSNSHFMYKEAMESMDSYMDRIATTVCGGSGWLSDVECGSKKCGMRCKYQCAKNKYEEAKSAYDVWSAKCDRIHKQYDEKKRECDNLQDQMDNSACTRAIDMKDACETYAECHTNKVQAFDETLAKVKSDEGDRHQTWRGLKRMQCLMQAFSDGEVDQSEIDECRAKSHSVDEVTVTVPAIGELEVCEVPRLYPTTGEYKKAEFAPLPAVAKGKGDANECTGVMEISTRPSGDSPETCECTRVTLNGPYSPGPMVKCTNCIDIRSSKDENSCPGGTKLFAPQSREDWMTFLSSAEPLRDPNWIIDVTRPSSGCAGCEEHPMNAGNREQQQWGWGTEDNTPWWLRNTPVTGAGYDYGANCYFDLFPGRDHTEICADSVTFAASKDCEYHSKSYYCQLESYSTTPKKGSPQGCRCKKVELTGRWSAGILLKCVGCLEVSKSTQKNSCPAGTKVFSPRTREDWKTFLDSATPLRSPSWIVDVTRPANGKGGGEMEPMNSDNLAQKTWRTADGSAWWLRSLAYTEPSGDYEANCYLDLWHNPQNENSVGFNDRDCKNYANSYYCQPVRRAERPAPSPSALADWSPPEPTPSPPPASSETPAPAPEAPAPTGEWTESEPHFICSDMDIDGVRRNHGTGNTLQQCKDKCLEEGDCVAIYGQLEDPGDGSCWTFPGECEEEEHEDEEGEEGHGMTYKVWHLKKA